MTSKEEIAKKGYMEGKYVTGRGKAHECCRPHKFVFSCEMFGTFNIRLKTGNLADFKPSIVTEHKSYWFVEISKGKECWYGWVVRDHNSRQAWKTLEVLTKEKLPESLKKGRFKVNVYEKWDEEQIKEWSKDQYWFETFPFTPKKRADSKFVWDTINRINWSGLSVLDIGCHYGYFSFKASEVGAKVIGFEPNRNSLEMARTIQKNIIHQDVNFRKIMPKNENFDIILYLSVHHQIDSTYRNLSSKIEKLKKCTDKHLFVELIIPPVFPKRSNMTESGIDKIVGGEVLVKYKHNVRGIRKIYWIEKHV